MNLNLNKQKFFVVYQITNLINGKIYIGAHITYNINDKYMGSSKHLKKDMKELGRQNFKKIPLYIFNNKEDMMNKEGEIVDRKFCHRTDTYNRIEGGKESFSTEGMITVVNPEGGYMNVYNDDPRWLSKELISAKKGNKSWLNKKHSKHTIEIMKTKGKERKHLEESIEKMRLIKLGKKASQETKDKMSLSRIGKKQSQETKDKREVTRKKNLYNFTL